MSYVRILFKEWTPVGYLVQIHRWIAWVEVFARS
jgi:hypothetical protein